MGYKQRAILFRDRQRRRESHCVSQRLSMDIESMGRIHHQAGCWRVARFGEILSNTKNTITFSSGLFGNLNFTPGNTFKIYKVNQAIDQPGRARGSLITGNPPVRPAAWNDQVTEPCYAWNNISGGTQQVGFGRGNLVVRPGEHYFNNTPDAGLYAIRLPASARDEPVRGIRTLGSVIRG